MRNTLFVGCLLSVIASSAFAEVDFSKQVAPIIEAHCVKCHLPGNAKGDTSLHNFDDLRDNEYVVAGKPDKSHLIDLIVGENGDAPQMPKDGQPLTKEDVAILRTWIKEGAKWPEGVELRERSKADRSWWSLQPIKQSPPDSTIDGFLLQRLSEQGLEYNPPATPRDLIRRVTYDLTGLPPTPEEVEAFVNSQDPARYEKLIDTLLASPRYGERWGRHWLDVVRFGESIGFERNVIINDIWPFRDYVIDSFNNDKPFDDFIREHIAGDVIAAEDPDRVMGTAFLVAGPYDDVGNQDAAQAAQIRANTLDEIINATGQAFLGLTVGCARCHDHKFDPISQADYYSWYATFSGVRHGAVPLATTTAKAERDARLKPLNARKAELEKQKKTAESVILQRGLAKLSEYEAGWPREAVSRTGTTDTFEPVEAKFVRFVSEAQDENPAVAHGFRLDEFEAWSSADPPVDVAAAVAGAVATGQARVNKDFPEAYSAANAIDRRTGTRFLADGTSLTIEFAQPATINRTFFHSAKGESRTERGEFRLVAEYRIEVSVDGEIWKTVASGADRKPVNDRVRNRRLAALETTQDDRERQAEIGKLLAKVNREIREVPAFQKVWIGKRVAADAAGPFHVFLGGSPQKKGKQISPASLSALTEPGHGYDLPSGQPEAVRRQHLADWLVSSENPLTPRVLANRIWHYHFGRGLVSTPNDFGYMGELPSHPELLDFLASQLVANEWKIKALHRQILLTQAYQQSSDFKPEGAKVDVDSRLLWRFPPRRLSAEEIRDTILLISGKLNLQAGGPGFRLYQYLQDNVSTYVPLPTHGPETYRRAVYHQNARASVVDLMTDFDQPDCAFPAARRAQTTTPLQALTMLNHSFTLDMAAALAAKVQTDSLDTPGRIRQVYRICFQREPTAAEVAATQKLVEQHGMTALCRVLLNTTELISVR